MPTKRDPSKALQIGFLALLIVSAAQVAWWIAENVLHARDVRARFEAAIQAGASEDVILGLLPRLADEGDARDGAGRDGELEGARLRAAALAALEEESDRRINRYLWEGGFFLVVLFGGMAVLTRTIRHDAELRRRQQNFLAAVSHEFKSPLASMRLAAETLVLRASDPDTQRLGRRILDDDERLLRMVDNLLDTTRLEEGRQRLEPEAHALADSVRACLDDLAERAAEHRIELTSEVDESLVLSVDRAALETMLRNLLDNAFKACLAGDGHRIAVEAVRRNREVVLAVTDDGIGFAPEDAAMMFEKFYRLGDELRRTTPGTGLGLYIVKRLAALSGATVAASSGGPGRGATVSIHWPESALA